MRTLQVSLDLTDDGDKVIFRQFGGEYSLRILQRGHTVFRTDQFDPDYWQFPEITAPTRSCRPRQKTTSNGNGPARSHPTIFPTHHLGSRVVNKCTVLFKTMSGIYGRAFNATSPGEAQRHETLWTIKQWKRLAH